MMTISKKANINKTTWCKMVVLTDPWADLQASFIIPDLGDVGCIIS